jgi:hypothetical protein
MADLQQVAADPRRDLLRDALDQRAQRSLDGLFRLLGIIQPQKAIETIWGNLRSTSPVARANAIEVLDNLIDSEEKRALLPAVEAAYELRADEAAAARGLVRVVERGQELYVLERATAQARLAELLKDRDPWLVVCALHAVAELGLQDAKDAVVGHLASPYPLVREAALVALSVLVPPATLRVEAQAKETDSDAAVRRLAGRLAQAAAAAATA